MAGAGSAAGLRNLVRLNEDDILSEQSPNLTRLPELQAGHLVQGQGHGGGEVQELKALTPGIKLLLLLAKQLDRLFSSGWW